MITELPKIHWKGKDYTFDYRLSELRGMTPITKKNPHPAIEWIKLTNQEVEKLQFAIESKDMKLVYANMRDLDWKLREVI